MINGEKQKELVFAKKIGLGLFKVVGFNPESNAKIKELGWNIKEDRKEPVYVDKSKDGNNRVRLDFYMEEVNTKHRWKESFFIEDTPSLSRANEQGNQKKEFINTLGHTRWVFHDVELPQKFADTDYHHALKGESLLIDFLKKLFNLNNAAECTYNFKKFLNGNFSELKDDLPAAENVVIPMTIRIEEKEGGAEGETVTYQDSFSVYARGFEYKYVNLKGASGWSEGDIDEIKEREKSNYELYREKKEGRRTDEKNKWINEIEKMVVDMSTRCRDVFFLGKIKDYVEGDSMPQKGTIVDAANYDI